MCGCNRPKQVQNLPYVQKVGPMEFIRVFAQVACIGGDCGGLKFVGADGQSYPLQDGLQYLLASDAVEFITLGHTITFPRIEDKKYIEGLLN